MAMSREQQLLEKWRKLPLEKQQEILNFVESKLLDFRLNRARELTNALAS